MFKKVAVALLAASMLTAPVLAQTGPTTTTRAPAAQSAAPKAVKHVTKKHTRKHVRHVKRMRDAGAAKAVHTKHVRHIKRSKRVHTRAHVAAPGAAIKSAPRSSTN
jgi:hypothetical protein